jgi:hypothetical protein
LNDTEKVMLCYWQRGRLECEIEDSLDEAVGTAVWMWDHGDCGDWWVVGADPAEVEAAAERKLAEIERLENWPKGGQGGPRVAIRFNVPASEGDGTHSVRWVVDSADVEDTIAELRAVGADVVKTREQR